MKGLHQMTRTIDVEASPAAIWAILADSTLLPQWAPVVRDVACLGGDTEGVGLTRRCNVEFAGRAGSITERCVEYVSESRIGYLVIEDTLGFNRMFADYGFTVTLTPRPPSGTTLRIDTNYTPRNAAFALINRLLIKRRMRGVVEGLLGGLKDVGERRAATATS
jgi:uncharacterized protein YndB with AHSA1/START domain